MKKSSTFMLAYIILLFISIGMAVCTEWDAIERISVAATVAGYFFALADLLGWMQATQIPAFIAVVKEQEALAKRQKSDLQLVRKRIREMKRALEYLKSLNNKNEKIRSLQDKHTTILASFEELECEMQRLSADIEELCNHNAKMIKRYRLFKPAEDILFTLGFLEFLVILVFDNYLQHMLPQSSIISVLAFAIIMSTYFVKDLLDEKYAKQITDSKQKIEMCKTEIEQNKAELKEKPLFDEIKRQADDILKQEEESNGQTENAQCE